MILKHSPIDELNNIYKKWEKTPYEERAGLRGELQKWARQAGIDIRDVNPQKIASQSEFELKDEAGEFLDSKRRIGAEYVDLREDLSPRPQSRNHRPNQEKKTLSVWSV